MNAPRTLPLVQPGPAQGTEPIFPRVGIIGLGLIGGSIALAARRTWPAGLVIAVDDKAVLEKAMVLHAIDVAADDPTVLAEADLVILAAPIRQNIAALSTLDEHVSAPAVVTDVGSTKRTTVDAAGILPPRFTFIGGHPLGGAARSGIEYARPDLFAGRPWIFTPTSDAAGPALERLYAFAGALGAIPQQMDPDHHDRLMAFVSHLPQLAASALMQVVGEGAGDQGLALAGRGLLDATRLASSPGNVWQDVCATNAESIASALDAFIEVLGEMRADLTSGVAIERIFESANAWRERLEGPGAAKTSRAPED